MILGQVISKVGLSNSRLAYISFTSVLAAVRWWRLLKPLGKRKQRKGGAVNWREIRGRAANPTRISRDISGFCLNLIKIWVFSSFVPISYSAPSCCSFFISKELCVSGLIWSIYSCQFQASTNQVAEQRMQLYNLPWKILGEVMKVELKVLASSCL